MTEVDAAGTRRLTFLGTGTSTGVPMIGCDCQVCTSTDPRNQRTRPSVLFSFPAGNLLIDTTPEMRMQLVRERVRQADLAAQVARALDAAGLAPGRLCLDIPEAALTAHDQALDVPARGAAPHLRIGIRHVRRGGGVAEP